ncbi:hypothetical protein JTB14_025537 [Gonioctena quinquepunctata]|nr:hypothetical protein JTB14_025537 [Gonioctena quinquepunctata]
MIYKLHIMCLIFVTTCTIASPTNDVETNENSTQRVESGENSTREDGEIINDGGEEVSEKNTVENESSGECGNQRGVGGKERQDEEGFEGPRGFGEQKGFGEPEGFGRPRRGPGETGGPGGFRGPRGPGEFGGPRGPGAFGGPGRGPEPKKPQGQIGSGRPGGQRTHDRQPTSTSLSPVTEY